MPASPCHYSPERDDRLTSVLHVLYLMFNEGYAATSGPSLQRTELAAEAIRLARLVHRLLPDDSEVDRPARADAAHRRPTRRPHRTRRVAHPDGRAGPAPLEPRTRSPRAWR